MVTTSIVINISVISVAWAPRYGWNGLPMNGDNSRSAILILNVLKVQKL